MADPVITVTYDDQPIVPAPTVSYSTQLVYNNDLVIGYTYKITLNGHSAPIGTEEEPFSISKLFNDVVYIKNVFSSNGGTLSVKSDDKPLLRITDIKILSINWNESSNNWTKSIPYTIELEANNLHLGADLTDDPNMTNEDIVQGKSDEDAYKDLHSPYIVDIERFSLKACNENFSINVDDNIFNQLSVYVDYTPGMAGNTTFISNNYYTVTLTVSATGKHDIFTSGEGTRHTLPAWETAKRYVQSRLVYNLNKLGAGLKLYPSQFMATGSIKQSLDQLHGPAVGNTNLITSTSPKFQLYNETITFGVSESDGSFEATYSAIVKQNCPDGAVSGLGCYNSAIHTITKTVNKTFNANEQTNSFNQEISISVNGQIRGLVPGYNILEVVQDDIAYPSAQGTTGAGLGISNFSDGSFLAINLPPAGGGTREDKNYHAEMLFNTIFNPVKFDLFPNFKTALGITHQALNINPLTEILPSKMTLTRNQIEGTINYSAEYNNQFNCPTNHYSVDLSVEEPVPVIQEFIIPNNNNNAKGEKGYPFIQYLGTQTAKKINVTINGNIGETFDKCCLGADLNWNLLDPNRYQFFSLGAFSLPPNLTIPEIDQTFVLTSKTKKTSYPDGKFTISLAYTCATVCSLVDFTNCDLCVEPGP